MLSFVLQDAKLANAESSSITSQREVFDARAS